MKILFKFLLVTLFTSSVLFSQGIMVEKYNEDDKSESYIIDAHQFLEKQEQEVTEFLNKNPEYFNNLALKKQTAWNFTVGSTKEWWASNIETNSFYKVPSTCQAVGTHCYIFVEDTLWNNKVKLENVNKIKEAFDSKTPGNSSKGIYETVVGAFGTPPNVDGDEKIIILILDIQDGYNGSGGYVAGYFHSVNEISHSNSNMAEIYYLDANPADLSTERGLTNVMSTTAHEFQHMIHFNYHNGSAGKPSQITFLNEACSMVSEVVCGYEIGNQSLYNDEYNHYLLDWRDGDEVLTDYSRAARYMTYFYNQFGTDFLGKFVQSSKFSLAGIDDALSKLTTATSLRFSETLVNWFMANIVNDVTVNAAWGYTTPNVTKVNSANIVNPNYTSPTVWVQVAAADYITYSGGKNLSIKFDDFGKGIIKFKAIKYDNDNNVVVEDISANTQLSYPDFGTKYKAITFVAMNTNKSFKANYTYTSSGESGTILLAYDQNPPVGVLPLNANDTVCVFFDGVTGGTVDSITVALRQAGSVKGAIYEYTGNSRPTPLGKTLVPNLTITSNIAEKPGVPYPEPWTNWITVDLTSYNIDASKPFVVAFLVEGTYPEKNRIMVTRQPTTNNHSFSYLSKPSSGIPNWFYISSSDTEVFAYLIRAYVNTTVDVDDNISDIVPNKFSLSQNYPNPFNPSTTISYSLAKSGFVTLKIYNMLGQEVAQLVSENKGAGNFTAIFDASKISSGTYIYELQNNGNRIAKKMLLLK